MSKKKLRWNGKEIKNMKEFNEQVKKTLDKTRKRRKSKSVEWKGLKPL